MLKNNKSRKQKIATGVFLGMMILIIAVFGRAAGEKLSAAISIDGIFDGISIDTSGFSLNSGGNSSRPGCTGDCLTVPPSSAYEGVATETSFRGFLITWTNFFLGFLGIVAMIALIYAGFLYITAAGNDEQVGKAKKIIGWVVIGIIVILLAFALVNTLITTGPTGDDRTVITGT